ncbi:EAL domain-containing protein [Novosphingobium sp.]|uniref:putative bifunctional diguanylate cyclase/phosphodiesterase n=1 Tax=Novosphingobium sp. TaxID=1874826 RepID=UPI00261C3F15|nr:EAL domain-containing protein [Novosphingobium sp.]
MTDLVLVAARAALDRWRAVSLCLACGLALGMGLSGQGTGLDRVVRTLVWSARQTQASGTLQLVEIDARSIAAIDRWPWPRGNYVRAVENLHKAGAASISFDVDFSSSSSPAEDAAFGQAIRNAGGTVTLATFVQAAGGGTEGLAESLPIPVLRENAALAAVSVMPDRDGTVRRMPLGVVTANLARPSLAAMIAGVDGAVEKDFPIDFAIDPATIPRHSFMDIAAGRFDGQAIRGKHIIIGATAVEMGDRYAAPRWGVLPGVVIQALAGETLMRGVPHEGGWQLPLLLMLMAGAALLLARSWFQLAAGWVSFPLALLSFATLLDAVWNWSFLVAPALAGWLLLGIAAAAMRLLNTARKSRRHDAQTGLPNRLALEEALQTYAAPGLMVAVIGNYERIASGLGGQSMAALVQRVHDRIATVISDGTIYRLDDRILAWRLRDRDDLDRQIATLRTFMLSPVEVAGKRVDVTLGMGFAAEGNNSSAYHVIDNAMLAAAHAIADGTIWREYGAADADTVDLELSLLGELDEAVEQGEIFLLYQPKLDLRSNRIVSVEALVRWQHPVRGFLRPDIFIPLAERNDRIGGLTLHVLSLALADLQKWHADARDLTCAVNISAKLLTEPAFLGRLQALITASGINPQWLTLEVTESAAMHDPDVAAAALRSFRDMGIAISMDDYGTGQSTLSYLKQLPLSELKIDRSFVQFAHQNRGDGALVRSTIDLAHELGLKVVAEGVEDTECLAFLTSVGCDMAQGYLISKPVPAADISAMTGTQRAAA